MLLPVVLGDGTAVVRSEVSEADLRAGRGQGLGGHHRARSGAAAWRPGRSPRGLGRRISAPLGEVAAVAHRMREGNLAERAEARGTVETVELARALNGLAERTVELLAAERAAVADLSHRLRTPVTALRLDVDAVRDEELADRLREHIGALQRTVDAIVKEARRPVRTDLGDCLRRRRRRWPQRVAFWSALADDQLRAYAIELPERPVFAPLAADDLADVVDVLIDNVFAHTARRHVVRRRPAGRVGSRPGARGERRPVPASARRAVRRVRGPRAWVSTSSPGPRARRAGHVEVDPGPAGTRVEIVLPISAEQRH